MSWKEKLKEESRKERAKLKDMSWQDRIWYIWEYYKVHLGIIAALLLFVYLGCTVVYNSTFTTQLSYVVINDDNPETTGLEALGQAFKTHMGYGKKDIVELNGSMRIHADAPTSQLDYASMAKISALVSSKELDMIITDEATMRYYMNMDAFMDLEQALPEDLWQQITERVLYADDSQGQSVACAFDLSQTAFCEKTGVDISPCYVGIVFNSARYDTVIAWLRFVLELQP